MSHFQKKLFQNKLRQAEKSLGLDFDNDNDNDSDNDNDTITDENNDIVSSNITPTNSDQAGLYEENMSSSYDFNVYHDQQGLEEEEDEEEEENDQLADLLPPRGPFSKQSNSKIPSINKNINNITKSSSNRDTTIYPKWSDFFQKDEIITDDTTNYKFQTYYNPPNINNNNSNTSATSTNSFNPELNDYENEPVIFIAHHGAGSSGLTFAYLAKSINEISKRQYIQYNPNTNPQDIPSPGFFCYDIRGHGNTNLINREQNDNTNATSINGENYNLSIEQLILDFINIISKFYDSNFAGKSITPHFFLIGHSLGGSVLTNCLHDLTNGLFKYRPDIYSLIKGLTMIDIVEETAIKSLHHMNTFLNNLPKNFNTLNDSINWHLKNNLINNLNSAKISIPSYLIKNEKDLKYYWICKLNQTEPFWFNWFKNLSSNFIKLPNKISKLLILANNDNLDKDLMIGQMQGKYQLVVFRNNSAPSNITTTSTATTTNPLSAHAPSHQQQQQQFITTTATKSILVNDNNHISHFVHEDVPDKTAITLLEYIERNDFNHLTIKNSKSTTQLNYLNKLNAKWGIKN